MSNFRNNSLCWSNNSHPSKWWFWAKCWFCSGRTQITLQFTRIQHTQRDIKTPQWIERIELEKWFATDFKQVLLQIEFIFVHTVCKFQIRTPFEESNVYTQIKHKRFHLNVFSLLYLVLKKYYHRIFKELKMIFLERKSSVLMVSPGKRHLQIQTKSLMLLFFY